MTFNFQPLQMRDQILASFLQISAQIFTQWVDDGGYTQNVTLRSAYSVEQASYPLIDVQVQFPAWRTSAVGGVMKAQRDANGKLTGLPVYGGILEDVRIQCQVSAFSDSDRRQLSDVLQSSVLQGFKVLPGLGQGSMRWQDVLRSVGIRLKGFTGDVYVQKKQNSDTAHPFIYSNTFSFVARCAFSASPNFVNIKITHAPPVLSVTVYGKPKFITIGPPTG